MTSTCRYTTFAAIQFSILGATCLVKAIIHVFQKKKSLNPIDFFTPP